MVGVVWLVWSCGELVGVVGVEELVGVVGRCGGPVVGVVASGGGGGAGNGCGG